ncbi:hypothetical protein SD70_19735 [Gordoniibacillus kamchatkensis]|uniref:N-acetyltransferase domain-containing protein n=1 Tax=Gordoniibacillus kamchatkensis TaxID=1590651 RepID=A0ABR5AG13_9BACL|nr:GNAT family N-acetyltransferase [Paenibacillus sp. VKM B-2647]KIL39505.1 hypothetical protein SD70_19735 [Paenibacillus sp. VKM B-2647]
MDIDDIRRLEARAARTWPAAENVPLGGWLLRASGGVTKRANSVLTAGDEPSDGDWLQRVEAFYLSRGLTPTFQVTDGSPERLDELLDRHGYAKETPCLLMIAETETAAAVARDSSKVRHEDVRLQVSSHADDEWLDDFIRLEQFPPERLPFYQGLLERMPAGTRYFTLLQQRTAVAVATVVGEQGWGGVINVAVDERLRGQGLGKTLMASVAECCAEQQIDRLYLQVVANNEPAIRLYRRFGFIPAYGYHYRIKLDP